MHDRETVTIKEAQAIAHVSRRTIYNWMATNRITYVRTAGGSVRIYEETLWRHGNVDTTKND